MTLVLQRDGNPTPLGEAIQHYGRIYKSLHILHLIDDESYRREVKWIRNLQEGRQRARRADRHADYGPLNTLARGRLDLPKIGFPSRSLRARYSLVAGSWWARVIAMMCSAWLSWRSPPRLSRYWVR